MTKERRWTEQDQALLEAYPTSNAVNLQATTRNKRLGIPPGAASLEHAKVMQLARTRTEEAIDTLTEIMRDPGVNPGVRVGAANALLDRGWGKPTQGVSLDISGMSDHELFGRAAVLFRKYKVGGFGDK